VHAVERIADVGHQILRSAIRAGGSVACRRRRPLRTTVSANKGAAVSMRCAASATFDPIKERLIEPDAVARAAAPGIALPQVRQ